MPKKQPKNAYFFYMLDFKRREEQRGQRFPHGMADVSLRASASWNQMTPAEKAPYEQSARQAKSQRGSAPDRNVSATPETGIVGDIYTSHGIPYSFIVNARQERERAEQQMHRDIDDMVGQSYRDNSIASQEYVFAAANYFCKTSPDNAYIPAELALVKYTLADGCLRKFHAFVGPDRLPSGYAFEAREHSAREHGLTPPPQALGEPDLGRLMAQVAEYLADGNDQARAAALPPPPLFVDHDQRAVVASVFDQLCERAGHDRRSIRVYSLARLFFVLKQHATRYGMDEPVGFPSEHIAQAMIDRDPYGYSPGIACDVHAELDRTRFCALSKVTRQAFIFSDHICLDLGIELRPGKHVPPNADVSAAVASHLEQTTASRRSIRVHGGGALADAAGASTLDESGLSTAPAAAAAGDWSVVGRRAGSTSGRTGTGRGELLSLRAQANVSMGSAGRGRLN